jgi:predicted DCC family thiol-disulfide oxidoreductase YuxK
LRYASLQSDFAKETLKVNNLDISSGTIVFLEDKDVYIKSNAILRILLIMKGIYRLAAIFYVIPRPVRDSIYDWVSRNRYGWFGKHDSCPMPDPSDRELFIDI